MPRTRKSTPSYLHHGSSDRARAVWTDSTGKQKFRLLPGPYDSAESRAAYARLLLEIDTAPAAIAPRPGGIFLSELLEAYKAHAERYYRGGDGKPTSEFGHVKVVIRHTRELYGVTPAAEFGPVRMEAVRQKFIELGWSRKTINQQIQRLRRAFKWAASKQLIPGSVWRDLLTVEGLRAGRTAAVDPEPIEPVDNELVDATLPHLNRHVRGLVEFQRFTGCRPGEACSVRRSEIDTGGAVWVFRPSKHKTAWRGKSRTIAIGPKCQQLLREYFTPNLEDYLFSPRLAVEEFRADRAAKRKTPRYPSHVKRNASKRIERPKRKPHEKYNSRSYSLAVSRACERARVKPWQPNQLRHTFATRVRKEHGLEAAQVLLGHSKADVTQLYAEKNQELAASVALKIG